MGKVLFLSIIALLLVLYSYNIEASAPSLPSTISPANGSTYFSSFDLTCSGSIDPEGNPIYYQFWLNDPLLILDKSAYDGTVDASTVQWRARKFNVTESSIVDTVQLYIASTGEDDINVSIYSSSAGLPSTLLSSGTSTVPLDVYSNITIDELTLSANTDYWLVVRPMDGIGTIYFRDKDSISGQSAYYDGSWHSSTGNSPTFYLYRETPLLQNSTSSTYYDFDSESGWYCKACDSNGECSSSTGVYSSIQLSFSQCTSGNISLNLINKDEEDYSILSSTWISFFDVSSDLDVYQYDYNFSGLTNISFCLDPINEDVTLDGFIEYRPNNSSYSFYRQYYFIDENLNSNLQENITVYSLSDDSDDIILLTVKDVNNAPVQGAVIFIQKYVLGTWYTVSMVGTDYLGRVSSNYVLNTDYYNHVIYYNDELVYGAINSDENKMKVYVEDVVNGITFTLDSSSESYMDTWYSLQDLYYNLEYINQTNTTGYFKLEFADVSGTQWPICMDVKYGMSMDTYTNCGCSDTLTTSNSAIITCNINQSSGVSYYQAVGYITYNGSSYPAISLAMNLGEDFRIDWGSIGFVVAFLVQLTLLFVFIRSPTINIFVSTSVFVIFVALGVIFRNLPYTVLSLFVALSFLVASLKSEGGSNG